MTKQPMTLHEKECRRRSYRKSQPTQNQGKQASKSQAGKKGLEKDMWIPCDLPPCKMISNRKRQLSLYQYQAKKWDSPAKKEMKDLWDEINDMEVRKKSGNTRKVSRQKRQGGRNNRFDANGNRKSWKHKSQYKEGWNQDNWNQDDQRKAGWNRESRNQEDRFKDIPDQNGWKKDGSNRENQSRYSTNRKSQSTIQRPRRQTNQRSFHPNSRTFTVRMPHSQQSQQQANGFLLTEALLALVVCMITGFLLLSSVSALAKSQTLEVTQDMAQIQENAR